MVKTASFKRLILRAVLRQVSPMVIRLVSVADQMPLHQFHDVFRTILGWNGDLGYIVRVHGQQIISFRPVLLPRTGGECSVVDLSFHLRSSVDALRMKAMQMHLSKLGKQPNRSFASVLLAFSLFRFLHPHHTNSANARYLCESDEFEPPAKTGAIAAQTFLRHENLVYLC